MIARIKLPPGGFVLIGDGRKALVLVNRGDERYPDLRLAEILRAPSNPATHEQGTDQPGRAIVGSSRRSSLEQTDWHQIAEDRFADEVAADLARSTESTLSRPWSLSRRRTRSRNSATPSRTTCDVSFEPRSTRT